MLQKHYCKSLLLLQHCCLLAGKGLGSKVNILGVVVVWGNCGDIPTDQGSYVTHLFYVSGTSIWRLVAIKIFDSVKVFAFS